MRTLTFDEMSVSECGGEITLNDVITGACDVLTVGAIVYGVGVLCHWWNPKGWIDAALLAGSLGCWIYSRFC